MYLLILFLFLPETVISGPKCGGTFTASRGVLSTPNFPKKFTTPIHCQWIIDAHDAALNSSIIVYLTQLYVFEGLTFKEYTVYIDGFSLPGDEIFAVTEDTVSNVSFVRCHTHYLVITLNLSSLEGTHLRVLDGLLDVYGFNITYEITSRESVRRNVCTMEKCGFTGNCYDHFTHFSCDCFPGYTGDKCSEGAKSRCFVNGQPICRNGGTCTHVGDSAVICECSRNFTGTYCDIPVSKLSRNKGCEDCLISCPFDGTWENVCKCGGTEGSLSVNDSVGFESTVIVTNSTNTDLGRPHHREKMREYMIGLLRSESVSVENVQIIKPQPSVNAMTFRFVAPKREEKRIRSVINKWKHYGAIGNVSLAEKDIIMTTAPSLHLMKVLIGNDSVRINQDFILTCEARGSPRMIFRWFKNGVRINSTLDVSRNKWTKLIDTVNKGYYVAILLIEKATKLDEGEFTCQVEDYSMQQCRSINVKLRHPPSVWLDPISLTINKGQPFKIKCLSEVQRSGKYIYSWAKDNDLLPKNTYVEHYDILYPGGSVLQVSGLNRSATYTCLVQDGNVSSRTSIVVNVIDRSRITPCPADVKDEFSWPDTAPGTEYKQKCPQNFTGDSSRSCIMLENGMPIWLEPDYSNCTALDLTVPIQKFRNLIQGYIEITPLEVLSSFSNYVKNRTLLHGEGYVILDWVYKISLYNNFSNTSPLEEVTSIILEIVDNILDQVNSLNKEQQVLLLQRMMKNLLVFLVRTDNGGLYGKSLRNIVVSVEDFQGSTSGLTYQHYSSAGVDVNQPTRLIRIVYKNLSKFLPSKSIIRLSDDSDIEYEIVSSVVGVWLSKPSRTLDLDGDYFATFFHSAMFDKTEWDLKCAQATYASSNYAWDTDVCKTKTYNSTTTVCSCHRPGTMTLLLVKEPLMLKSDSSKPHDTIIIIGCSTCLLISSVCSVISLLNWIYHRSSFTFLKFQCCVSISGTMVLFILAFSHELPKDHFLYIVSFLQCFFFTGMSSQLSTLLIIYSELVEIRSKDSIQLTVVGIITGAPLIVVFGNHLAHRTLNIHLNYWWLLKGTLSFKVFTCCTVVMLVLFVLLYSLVFKITHNDKASFTNRSKLIKRTSLIFYSMIFLAAISIVYVNILEEVIWRYAFCIASVLMGLIVMSCSVFNSQFLTRKHLMEKLKLKQNKGNTSPQKSNNSQDEIENTIDLQLAAPPTTNFSPNIEQYNSSPTHIVSKSNSLNSPDILGSKVFVELDLVASSLQSASTKTPFSPMDSSKRSVSFENEKLAKVVGKAFDEAPKIASQTVSDSAVKFCDTKSLEFHTKVDSGQLDAVMNSISNDLNYLLNGHVEFKDQDETSHNRNCGAQHRNRKV